MIKSLEQTDADIEEYLIEYVEKRKNIDGTLKDTVVATLALCKVMLVCTLEIKEALSGRGDPGTGESTAGSEE